MLPGHDQYVLSGRPFARNGHVWHLSVFQSVGYSLHLKHYILSLPAALLAAFEEFNQPRVGGGRQQGEAADVVGVFEGYIKAEGIILSVLHCLV